MMHVVSQHPCRWVAVKVGVQRLANPSAKHARSYVGVTHVAAMSMPACEHYIGACRALVEEAAAWYSVGANAVIKASGSRKLQPG